MFLVTDLSEKYPHTSKVSDTKGVGNIVTAITGSNRVGHTAESIASNMRFGNEFICPRCYKVRCIPDDEAEATITENIKYVADREMTGCMDDYAARIWAVIGDDVIYNVLDCSNGGKDGFTDIDVALAIGRAVAERLGIEIWDRQDH